MPASWVAAATTPSQSFNRGYGLLWWKNGEGPTESPLGSGSDEALYAWAPSDLFAAHGFGSQFIDVIPSLDMVIVRFGKDPTADMTVTNATDVLMSDENTDKHREILEPILRAVRP